MESRKKDVRKSKKTQMDMNTTENLRNGEHLPDNDDILMEQPDFPDLDDDLDMEAISAAVDQFKEENPEAFEELENRMNDFFSDLIERMEKKTSKHGKIPEPPKPATEESAPYINIQAYMDFEETHPGEPVAVEMSDKTILDMMKTLDSADLFNYCKYHRMIDALEFTDEKKLQALYDRWWKDPEFLLYPFSPKGMEGLCTLPDLARSGKSYTGESLACIFILCLAEFDENRKVIRIATDLPDLVRKITPGMKRRAAKAIEKFDPAYSALIRHYGLLELDEVPGMMKQYFRLDFTEEQCYSMIYWHFTLPDIFKSFTLIDDGRPYGFEPGLDVNKIIPRMLISEFMAPYATARKLELEAMKTPGGYMQAYPGWTSLFATLAYNCQVNKDEARDVCDSMYQDVRNGADLETCMDLFMKQKENHVLAIRLNVWEVCLHFLLGTALPELKGNNRIKAFRDPRYSVFLGCHFAQNTVPEEKITAKTPVEKFPELIQVELGSRLFTLEESDLDFFVDIQKHYPKNIDLTYLTGSVHQRLGHKEEAIEYFRKAEQMTKGKDPSIQTVIQSCEKGATGRIMSVDPDQGIVWL